jgi:hypothetical protein
MKTLLELDESELREFGDDEAQTSQFLVETYQGANVVPMRINDIENFSPDSGMSMPVVLKLVVERLRLTDFEYDERTVIWASILADYSSGAQIGSLGRAVLWAYAIWKLTKEQGEPVTFKQILSILGDGVPNDDVYSELWEAQKDPNSPLGNLLDNPVTWGLAEEEVIAAV